VTSYVETAAVAHVMQLQDHVWKSICRVPLTVDVKGYRDNQDEWPLKWVWTVYGGSGEQPAKPWCSFCVATALRNVEELIGSVLIPAGEWA
jgi:hypothetical protein